MKICGEPFGRKIVDQKTTSLNGGKEAKWQRARSAKAGKRSNPSGENLLGKVSPVTAAPKPKKTEPTSVNSHSGQA